MEPFTAANIVPLLAAILCTVRFLMPVREVLAVRQDRQLGELNPVPFCTAILNTTGWIVYAVLNKNLYIFFGDGSGLLCSVWMVFSLYPYAQQKVQDRLNALIMLGAIFWCSLALATIVFQSTDLGHLVEPLWGWAASGTQVLLMASPLSTMVKAIQQHSSASFHLGLCVMNLVTSTLWVVYAGVIHSLIIGVPNLLGAVLSLAATLICFILPRSVPRTPQERLQSRLQSISQTVELGQGR